MGLPKNVAAYGHIQVVLDKALNFLQLEYVCASKGAAIRWRQEAYTFRRLLQDQGDFRYSTLFMQLKNNKVIIGRREAIGQLQTPEGEPVALAEIRPISEEELRLTREAEALANNLGLDVSNEE